MARAGAVYSGIHQTIKGGSNMKRQVLCVLTAAMLTVAMSLTGCGSGTQSEGTDAGQSGEAAASAGTGEQDREIKTPREPGNEEETMTSDQKTKDSAILVVSFGTSYNDSRDITIGAVEKAVAEAYPQYEVRRAFTAQTIIDILKKREGLEIDNMTQALDRAAADGIKKLIVQPTHLMDGFEYHDMVTELEEYSDLFDQIAVGKPLLSDEEDFKAVVRAITDGAGSSDQEDTAMVFMGHGTEAESNRVYKKLQNTLAEEGFDNYFIGTVEAEPDLDDVAAALREKGVYKKVVLRPLMLVAGDHANNDMAGDEEDSWKTVLGAEGYEVECVLQGLGELKSIQDLYVDHVQAAIESLEQP